MKLYLAKLPKEMSLVAMRLIALNKAMEKRFTEQCYVK